MASAPVSIMASPEITLLESLVSEIKNVETPRLDQYFGHSAVTGGINDTHIKYINRGEL